MLRPNVKLSFMDGMKAVPITVIPQSLKNSEETLKKD
jgi:hypothetical protein